MAGDAVVIRQGVVQCRDCRTFNSTGCALILSCILYFKFTFFLQVPLSLQDVSVVRTVMESSFMSRRELVGLTSGQLDKTHTVKGGGSLLGT